MMRLHCDGYLSLHQIPKIQTTLMAFGGKKIEDFLNIYGSGGSDKEMVVAGIGRA